MLHVGRVSFTPFVVLGFVKRVLVGLDQVLNRTFLRRVLLLTFTHSEIQEGVV